MTFITAAERDTLSRAGVIYATGGGIRSRARRQQFVLTPLRQIVPGRYTLERTSRHGRRRNTRRMQITIG